MWLYRINRAASPAIRGFWRMERTGAFDELPRRGPLILAANHASFLDPWFIGAVVPRPICNLITRAWYDKSPVWRGFFRSWGCEPVRPGVPRETVEALRRRLERGEACCIFPEGRISRDGRIQRFRSGVARVAAASGAPVVPLGLRGNFEALPRNRKIPTRATIRVAFGRPRTCPDDQDAVRAFVGRLEDEVRELAGQTNPLP